jgi:phospholipid/cholesterol/gamma-HCH transport system substrate-binding protein
VSLLRRKPRGPVKRDPGNPGPDERIFGRHYRGLGPVRIGLAVAIVFVALFYLAFTKHIPFTSQGYTLHATFRNATTLTQQSPVRIAGVNVGKVTSVQPKGNMAEVTFTVSNEGLPIHQDATITIRPRLFLEGNFFLDLQPGSPSARDLSSGSTIPMTQTATAVQIDQVLTSLQKDTRGSLSRALEGYGKALNSKPTPAEDATQDPAVQGLTGGEAINKTFQYGGKAGRTTSIVNEAILGQHPHDLSNLVRGLRNVFHQLASTDGALPDLITNFNTTAGALAAQSNNLSASLRELAPTLEIARPSLAHLNDALPPFRRLAIELEPGVRQLPATIKAGTPWLVQTNRLLQNDELGGTAKLLAQSAPPLAKTTHASLALFPQIGLTSRCVTHNLVPLGDEVVNDAGGAYPFSTGQPVSREFLYSVVGLAGESQGFDGNGSFVRFQAGGGPQLVKMRNPGPPSPPGTPPISPLFGNNISAPLGTRPALPHKNGKAQMPPFRMDVPCHTQAVPNLNGPAAAIGPPDPKAVP